MFLKTILSIAVSVFSLCFFLGTGDVASALTVSPLRLELQGEPGETIFGSFKLFNEQANNIKYYIVFRTFGVKDETGEPEFSKVQDELISWIESPDEIVVPAKDFKEVVFKVNIPAGADPGGHFAGIFASTVPPYESDGGNVKIVGEVGSLMLFRVNGDFKQAADILEFNTKGKQSSFTELPVWFYYRFQNSGDDYIKPLGDIIIKNMFGSTIKVISGNKDRGNILPKSVRRFDVGWFEAGGSKNQGLEAEPPIQPDGFWDHVAHQWDNFAFGKYTAQLNLAYGNSTDKAATAEVSFWMIPWHLLLVIGGGLVIFLGGMIVIAVVVAIYLLKFRQPIKKKPIKRKKVVDSGDDSIVS